jgi:hypothetical protein
VLITVNVLLKRLRFTKDCNTRRRRRRRRKFHTHTHTHTHTESQQPNDIQTV